MVPFLRLGGASKFGGNNSVTDHSNPPERSGDGDLTGDGPTDDPSSPGSDRGTGDDGLTGRRRKVSFGEDGRAIRDEPADVGATPATPTANDPSPGPGLDNSGQPSEAPWELEGPPDWSSGGGSAAAAPDWAQPAPPGSSVPTQSFPDPVASVQPPGTAWPQTPPSYPNPSYPGYANPSGQSWPGSGPAANPPGNWAPTPPGHVPFYQPGIGYYGTYAEGSQASLAAWLSGIGLASILFCAVGLFLCPVGWYFAGKELKGIKDGRRDPQHEGTARAAQIMGIIGTALVVLGVLGIAALITLGASA